MLNNKNLKRAIMASSLTLIAISLAIYFVAKRSPSKDTASSPATTVQVGNETAPSPKPNSNLNQGLAPGQNPVSDLEHGNGTTNSGLVVQDKSQSIPQSTGQSTSQSTGQTLGKASGVPTVQVPGKPEIGVGVASTEAIQKEEPKKEVPKISQGCVTLAYTHKKITSHEDGEACSKHKNLLTLRFSEQADNALINSKSICVQVNGATVKHQYDQKHKQQVMIGPEAGPHAKITVRYCLGETPCNIKCPAPQDHFLSALGADESDSVSAENSEDGPEMEKEMIALVQKIDELASDPKEDLFNDWLLEKQTVACQSGRTQEVAHLDGKE